MTSSKTRTRPGAPGRRWGIWLSLGVSPAALVLSTLGSAACKSDKTSGVDGVVRAICLPTTCLAADAGQPDAARVAEQTVSGPRPTAVGGAAFPPQTPGKGGRYWDTPYVLAERRYYPDSSDGGSPGGSCLAGAVVQQMLTFSDRQNFQSVEALTPIGGQDTVISSSAGTFTVQQNSLALQTGCGSEENGQVVEFSAPDDGSLWLFPTADRADHYLRVPPQPTIVAGQKVSGSNGPPGGAAYSVDYNAYYAYVPSKPFTSVMIEVEQLADALSPDATNAPDGGAGGFIGWDSDTTQELCGQPETCCRTSEGAASCKLVIREGEGANAPVIPGKIYFVVVSSNVTFSFTLRENP